MLELLIETEAPEAHEDRPGHGYIEFVDITDSSAATSKWLVRSRDRWKRLGEVRWYYPLHAYCIFPDPGTHWSSEALAVVRQFVLRIGRERMRKRSRSSGATSDSNPREAP